MFGENLAGVGPKGALFATYLRHFQSLLFYFAYNLFDKSQRFEALFYYELVSCPTEFW